MCGRMWLVRCICLVYWQWKQVVLTYIDICPWLKFEPFAIWHISKNQRKKALMRRKLIELSNLVRWKCFTDRQICIIRTFIQLFFFWLSTKWRQMIGFDLFRINFMYFFRNIFHPINFRPVKKSIRVEIERKSFCT